MNKIVFDDWLAVSTDGFASMNAGREPAHLVKELVQNSAGRPRRGRRRHGRAGVPAGPAAERGRHHLPRRRLRDADPGGHPHCFYTSKTDNHQRGRMGRGFKEMLCLATAASVESGGRTITFATEDGRRITRLAADEPAEDEPGTVVRMEMPGVRAVIPGLEAYFRRLLPPAGVVRVNGRIIAPRPAAHRVESALPTELFDAGRWVRPPRRTAVVLVPTEAGEEPFVYELGIPVLSGGSGRRHADVRQRVPMNPCRDAVASGYLQRLHRACLPVLLAEMSGEQVRQDWVGTAVAQGGRRAAAGGDPPRVPGDNLARSVPPMGVRQYDEDVREIGVAVIDTRQTSGGFRQILQRDRRPPGRPSTAVTGTRWPPPRAASTSRGRSLGRRRGNGPAKADRGGRRQGACAAGDGLRPLVLPAAARRLRRRHGGRRRRAGDDTVCSVTIAPLRRWTRLRSCGRAGRADAGDRHPVALVPPAGGGEPRPTFTRPPTTSTPTTAATSTWKVDVGRPGRLGVTRPWRGSTSAGIPPARCARSPGGADASRTARRDYPVTSMGPSMTLDSATFGGK